MPVQSEAAINFPQVVADFPDMKGLSYRNLKYIRQWYQFYNEQLTIGQQVVAQLDDVNVQQLVAQIQDKDFKKG